MTTKDGTFLFKAKAERVPKKDSKKYANVKGLYALLNRKGRVVYVGKSGWSTSRRLQDHAKERDKHWTQFSIYQVHDNIPERAIRELEGLLLDLYKDGEVNQYNKQEDSGSIGSLPKIDFKSLRQDVTGKVVSAGAN